MSQEQKFFRYAMHFYKDGKLHTPEMNETFTSLEEEGIEECFSKFIGKYYKVKLRIPTSCFVYDGVRIPRTNENEQQFEELEGEIERTLECRLLEIWRYSYQEQELPIPKDKSSLVTCTALP